MHGDSTYNIMFGEYLNHFIDEHFKHFVLLDTQDDLNCFISLPGPDICGPGTKKVHVIFNYKGKNHLINKDLDAR